MSLARLLRRLPILLVLVSTAAPAQPERLHGERARILPAEVPTPRPQIATGEIATARFRIVHTARSEGPAKALAERIEELRERFQRTLGRDWPGVTEIRLGYGRAELEALALPGAEPPSWAVALAYPGHNVVLVEAHSMAEGDGLATLRHELAHVALGQLGGPWPRWFQEGFAMFLTGEERFSLSRYATLFRAVRQDRVFELEDLAERWPDHPTDVEIAYAQSAAFVGFLSERHGPAALGHLLDGVSAGEPFEMAFAKAFRATVLFEEKVWRGELPDRYSWWPIVTGGGTLWALAAVLTVIGYLRRKAVVARRRAEQEVEEAAQDALRILEAEAHQAAPGLEDDEPSKPTLH